MLTLLAFAMVATFMFLIMTRRLSALIALILVPIAFALIGGFAAGLGPMMLDGIRTLAPTGVMLMFAILYFAIMIDSGLFDPAVRRILKLVKGDPLKVSLGTAALAMIVSLDGDGSTTYMICVAAVLPLYSRLGMSPLVMACLIMLSSGVLNMTPWGGPTARAASALHVDPADIFVPMIPAMIAGLLAIFAIAWIVLGLSFVVNPLNGMSSLAILFGFLFVLGGISRIVNGCQTRKQSGAGWNIFIGLLDLLIACLWLAMNPQQSWLFITAFIGVEMIFSAIGLLVLRNKMKHAQA